MTEEYLCKRAKRGFRELFLKALAQVPDVEPDENDRLRCAFHENLPVWIGFPFHSALFLKIFHSQVF